MKNLFILLVVVIFTCSCATNPVEIAKKASISSVTVVKVNKSGIMIGSGTGFVIDKETIVTNVHVVSGGESVYIVTDDNLTYKVDGYLAMSEDNDLAILKVSGLNLPSLPLCQKEEVEVGEQIYVIGNPKGFTNTFSEGIISGKRSFETTDNIQITASISFGSSGGAVLNSHAQVVGIIVAMYGEGQNLNFAIPVKYLKELVKKPYVLKDISKI